MLDGYILILVSSHILIQIVWWSSLACCLHFPYSVHRNLQLLRLQILWLTLLVCIRICLLLSSYYTPLVVREPKLPRLMLFDTMYLYLVCITDILVYQLWPSPVLCLFKREEPSEVERVIFNPRQLYCAFIHVTLHCCEGSRNSPRVDVKQAF